MADQWDSEVSCTTYSQAYASSSTMSPDGRDSSEEEYDTPGTSPERGYFMPPIGYLHGGMLSAGPSPATANTNLPSLSTLLANYSTLSSSQNSVASSSPTFAPASPASRPWIAATGNSHLFSNYTEDGHRYYFLPSVRDPKPMEPTHRSWTELPKLQEVADADKIKRGNGNERRKLPSCNRFAAEAKRLGCRGLSVAEQLVEER